MARFALALKRVACALLLAAAARAEYTGSAACAPCHAAQARGFARSPMGRSLAAADGPEFARPVQFHHPATDRRYRIGRRGGAVFMEEFFLAPDGRPVYTDARAVRYAIGSGSHARSYLVEQGGQLYQAPVAFYRRGGKWDMSPGYDTAGHVGFSRRVTANCLFCHSGRVNTRNAAGDLFELPFAETAIGCERCHGPGERHAKNPGGAIVNPARLAPRLRDHVCDQCHLFGAARVAQPGRSPADYRAGQDLGAVIAIYASDGAAEPSVTGHALEMRQSLCRLRSEGALWCGSCHQVHAGSPISYRAKCLTCHAADACRRAPDNSAAHRAGDCIACHMPKRPAAESAHVALTDHRIRRRPGAETAEAPGTTLRAIVPENLDDPVAATRNLGFAYAAWADATGRSELYRKVIELLRPLAGTAAAGPAFWQNLGEAQLAQGEIEAAGDAFRQAAESAPGNAAAHYSLGYVYQRLGKLPEAVRAYRQALAADPAKAEARANLAAAYAAMGNQQEARREWAEALRLEPGNLRWRAAAARSR